MVKKGITLVVILLLISVSVIPSTARDVEQSFISPLYDGKTLYVGGSGPNNYTSIQEAIDNASDGDTVFVYNGTYVENVVVDRSISLVGEDKDTTVIDGSENGNVIYISADWVNISGFTIQNSSDFILDAGISILYCNFSRIKDNNIVENKNIGIELEDSNNNTISGNYFFQNEGCIKLSYSNHNTISDNNAQDNEAGIILVISCNFNHVSDNILRKVPGAGFHDPMIYTGWYCNNTSITNNIISGCYRGIRNYAISSRLNISGNIINDCDIGMSLPHIENCIIYGNWITNCSTYGIHSWLSEYNAFSYNTISNNFGHGLFSENNFNSNAIFNNTVNSNIGHGVYLTYASRYNTIFNNSINFNAGNGLYLKDISDDNNIHNNNIKSNAGHGIFLIDRFNDNNIFYNNISLNNGYGIKFENGSQPCKNNTVYNNNFINNNHSGYDNCTDNTWDNDYPSGGNYWSDYNGKDDYRGPNQDILGSDSIGDTPYNLSGGDNQDRYPLIYPWGKQRPVANYTYNIEYGGYIFNGSLSYDCDGVVLFYEWDFSDGSTGQGVTVAHGFNETGTYNVTLVVTDDDGYQGSYTRSIDAVKNNPPSTPSIDGPVEEKARKSHLYDFTSEDPESADVSYYIEWGDGAIEDWSDFQPSGEPYDSNHGWMG